MPHLRNPHSVLAALKVRPPDVTEIRVPRGGSRGDAWEQVIVVARRHSIPVSERSFGPGDGESSRPGERSPPRGRSRDREEERADPGRRTAGAEAVVRERAPVAVERLFEGAPSRASGRGLWLALDRLQDPHNIGAIFRSAAFFGVQGILLTQERSAPLTGTVYDVSSGGIEHVPFSIQPSLQHGFEKAKEAGLWILGTSEHSSDDLATISRDRPWLLVIGNEEKGMRRLTEEACDVLCRITPRGPVTSLNASVAASICISALTS